MTDFLLDRDLACNRVDPELFFPLSETGDAAAAQIAEARSVCFGCPVRSKCLELALDTGSEGLWAGTTTKERRAMLRRSSAFDLPVAKPAVGEPAASGEVAA